LLLEEAVGEAAPLPLLVAVEVPVELTAPVDGATGEVVEVADVPLDCVAALTRAWSRAEKRLNPCEAPWLSSSRPWARGVLCKLAKRGALLGSAAELTLETVLFDIICSRTRAMHRITADYAKTFRPQPSCQK
jgi:hypothetical protein